MMPLFLLVMTEPEKQAFITELYDEYYRLVRFEISKMHGNKNEIEDLIQDVFLLLIQNEETLKDFEPKQRTPYIIRTVQTTVYKHWRDHAKDRKVQYFEDLEEEPYYLDRRMLQVEDMECFRPAVEALNPKDRHALEMKYAMYYTDKQIADALGVALKNVRMTLSRARNRFKKLIKKFFDEQCF